LLATLAFFLILAAQLRRYSANTLRHMSIFDLNDRVTLVKADGTRVENIPADVQPKMIFIDDASIPVEEGDRLQRTLPSKLVESYVVLDRGFYSDAGGFGDHYQIQVRKETAITAMPHANVFNLHGPNSRVNIQSTDHSSNSVHIEPEAVFEGLRAALRSGIHAADQESLLRRVERLEVTSRTPSFAAAYKDFIQAAANHITIIAPFIPALTSFLNS
jgi:hypothetical protein